MNGPGSDPRAVRSGGGGFQAPNERIIWFAFLISPAIYAFVGYMVAGGPTMPGKAPALPFYVVGLLIALVASVVPRFIPRGELTVTEIVVPARVISWAMDESLSIVGFVGFFLGAFPIATFVLFALASMGLIGLHRPGD